MTFRTFLTSWASQTSWTSQTSGYLLVSVPHEPFIPFKLSTTFGHLRPYRSYWSPNPTIPHGLPWTLGLFRLLGIGHLSNFQCCCRSQQFNSSEKGKSWTNWVILHCGMTTIVCHDSILVIALAMELMTTVNWEHDVIWMLYYVEHRSQQSGITVVLYLNWTCGIVSIQYLNFKFGTPICSTSLALKK